MRADTAAGAITIEVEHACQHRGSTPTISSRWAEYADAVPRQHHRSCRAIDMGSGETATCANELVAASAANCGSWHWCNPPLATYPGSAPHRPFLQLPRSMKPSLCYAGVGVTLAVLAIYRPWRMGAAAGVDPTVLMRSATRRIQLFDARLVADLRAWRRADPIRSHRLRVGCASIPGFTAWEATSPQRRATAGGRHSC